MTRDEANELLLKEAKGDVLDEVQYILSLNDDRDHWGEDYEELIADGSLPVDAITAFEDIDGKDFLTQVPKNKREYRRLQKLLGYLVQVREGQEVHINYRLARVGQWIYDDPEFRHERNEA